MSEKEGKFRFAYFTNMYEETCEFYTSKLGFKLEHSWDRNANDKGSLFKAGLGLIEVLLLTAGEKSKNEGLDYRSPQGAFMVIQVWDIDALFDKLKSKGVQFKQEIVDQSWGHRSFTVLEPNGLVLHFIQDPFDSRA